MNGAIGRKIIAVVAIAELAGTDGAAGQQDQVEAALRRIFASRDFAGDRFGPARWLDDGTYTTVEPSTSVRGGADIVRYDAATGQRECTSLPRS